MSSYPNLEVEREVRSRITGAMEAAAEKRESDLRELAGSKHAPGPGCGSGPYEQKRIGIYLGFYDTLFRDIVDNWFEVLTRQNGRVTASDVDHIVKEVEEWGRNAPRNIQQALISHGTTAARLPQSTIVALRDNAGQKVHGLVIKYRRELQTRLYDQNHPHPKEIGPVPNVSITKINSDNVNSIVASVSGNKVVPGGERKKGWWETWWGVVVTSVIAGLVIWGATRYLDRPSPKTALSAQTTDGKPAQLPSSTAGSKSDGTVGATSESGRPKPLRAAASPSPPTHPKQAAVDSRNTKDFLKQLAEARRCDGNPGCADRFFDQAAAHIPRSYEGKVDKIALSEARKAFDDGNFEKAARLFADAFASIPGPNRGNSE
jgi:hypothetical protein